MFTPAPSPTRVIRREYGEGESFYKCYLFRRLTDAEVDSAIAEYTAAPYWGGPGRQYVNRAGVRHTARRTLICQRGGWDI